jgi:hypothetical protein
LEREESTVGWVSFVEVAGEVSREGCDLLSLSGLDLALLRGVEGRGAGLVLLLFLRLAEVFEVEVRLGVEGDDVRSGLPRISGVETFGVTGVAVMGWEHFGESGAELRGLLVGEVGPEV